MGHRPLEVEVSGRGLVSALTVVAFGLILLSYAQDLLHHALPGALPRVWRFDVDVEVSVPTWFSSGLILLNACMLALLATAGLAAKSRWRWHWLVLAAVFVGLSLDETLSLHETLSGPVKRALGTGGLLFFAWVLPLMAACLAGFLAYLSFLRALEPVQRTRLLLAAAIYLAGAVGVEMVGGAQVESQGVDNLAYRTLATLEEALEMLGMLLCLNFVLREVAARIGSLRLRMA